METKTVVVEKKGTVDIEGHANKIREILQGLHEEEEDHEAYKQCAKEQYSEWLHTLDWSEDRLGPEWYEKEFDRLFKKVHQALMIGTVIRPDKKFEFTKPLE